MGLCALVVPFCMQTLGAGGFLQHPGGGEEATTVWSEKLAGGVRPSLVPPSLVRPVTALPGDLKIGHDIKMGHLSVSVGMPLQTCPASEGEASQPHSNMRLILPRCWLDTDTNSDPSLGKLLVPRAGGL